MTVAQAASGASPIPAARSLRERLRSGTVWALLGAVVPRLFTVAASVICARLLRQSAYGELGIIQGTVGMFGVLAGFGLGTTSTKYVAEFRTSDPARAGRVIGLATVTSTVASALMALLLFAFASPLAEHSLAAPHLVGALRISALTLFFAGMAGAAMGALAGLESFRRATVVNVVVGALGLPVMVAGVAWAGVEGGAWALTVAALLSWLGYVRVLRSEMKAHQIPPAAGAWRSEWRLLWAFSVPATLASAVVAPVSWFCSAMLVHRPDGYAEMGIFSATNQWFQAVLFLPNVVGQVLLPVLSERFGAGDTAKLRRLLLFGMGINAAFALPLVLAVAPASGSIMGLYGDGFAAGGATLTVAVLTGGVLAVQAPVGNVLVATGRLWTGFFMNCGWAVVFVTATWLLVDRGALGLATARLIAYIAHGLWTWFYAYWLLRRREEEAG